MKTIFLAGGFALRCQNILNQFHSPPGSKTYPRFMIINPLRVTMRFYGCFNFGPNYSDSTETNSNDRRRRDARS